MPDRQTIRRSVVMTPEVRAHLLQQLVLQEPGNITEADLIRQAIREYLDQPE